MSLKHVSLCLLAILSLGAALAAAQSGYSMQQSFGMTGMFNQTLIEDFMSFPWFGFESNASFDDSFPGDSIDFGDAYDFFSEYYVSTSIPIVSGIVSTPVKFDINRGKPSKIYFGSGKQVAYNQYVATPTRGNELWIQGATDWSQYVVAPAGTGLQLVAFTPAGGQADFYEIIQTNVLNVTSKRYSFYSGYNSMNFYADKVGRHILLFMVNNQPSNVIIVDVISPAPPAIQTQPLAGQIQYGGSQSSYKGSMPPANQQYLAGGQMTSGQMTSGQTAYGGSYGGSASGASQSSSYQYTQYTSAQTPAPIPVPVPQPASGPSLGDTPVTIQTTMKGYDVWVDGVYIGKEGTGGDSLDGVYRFNVVGGKTHTIRIFDGVNNYEKPMYFERGVSKIINVPPAATVYVSGGLI